MHFYLTTNPNLTKFTQLIPSSTSAPASHYEIHYEKKIQDALMWIDLDDEISKPMIHNIEDKEGNPTGQQRIVIPGVNFYSKEGAQVVDKTGLRPSHTKSGHPRKTQSC